MMPAGRSGVRYKLGIPGILAHEIGAVFTHDVPKEVRLRLKSRSVRVIVAASPAYPLCPVAVPVSI